MEDDRTEVGRLKRPDDADRPPPIPPRPSFTFASRRGAQPQRGNSTTQQADVQTDSTSERLKAEHSGKPPVLPPKCDLPESGKSQNDSEGGKPPVPPRSYKSNKLTDQSSVDVSRDERCSATSANDEVFVVCEDAKPELVDDAVKQCQADCEDAKPELADDAVKQCQADCEDAKPELADDAVKQCQADCEDAKSELVDDAMKQCQADNQPAVSQHPQSFSAESVPCSVPVEQMTDCTIASSAGSTDDSLSCGSVAASSCLDTIIVSDDTLTCEQLAEDNCGTTNTGVVLPDTGVVLSDERDSQLHSDSVEELNDSEVTEAAEGMADTRQPSQSSEQTCLQQTSPKLLTPDAVFSEFDDFGLDPDLFRPDCLETDVLSSEKTTKFTRSASPLYESVLDEDETGLSVLFYHQ